MHFTFADLCESWKKRFPEILSSKFSRKRDNIHHQIWEKREMGVVLQSWNLSLMTNKLTTELLVTLSRKTDTVLLSQIFGSLALF